MAGAAGAVIHPTTALATCITTSALCAVLALCACKRPGPEPTLDSGAPGGVDSGASSGPDVSRRLALARPEGSGPADARLRQMQRRLSPNPSPDEWLALGFAWVAKARESSDAGFYAYADACSAEALKRDPAHRGALLLHGLVLYNGHRFAEARDIARSVLRSAGEDLEAHTLLSDALLELGVYDETEAEIRRCVGLDPSLASLGRLSYLLWLKGDEAGALAAIDRALEAAGPAPEPRAWARVERAKLLWHKGQYAKADAELERALALVPGYVPALTEKGRVALSVGDAKRAAAHLEAAHSRAEGIEPAWLLGDALTLAGDEAGAQRAYAFAEREGRRGDARTLSLFYSTYAKNAEEALELARNDRRDRASIFTEDTEAWALFRLGRVAEAKTAIESATRLGTRDARLLFHKGAILAANGQKKEGAALAARALAQNPKFDVVGAREARALATQGR